MTKANKAVAVDHDDAADETTKTEENFFSAKDLASECGVDGKAFRRWLRSTTDRRANKGGRWKFTAEEKSELLTKWADKDKAPAAEEAKA